MGRDEDDLDSFKSLFNVYMHDTMMWDTLCNVLMHAIIIWDIWTLTISFGICYLAILTYRMGFMRFMDTWDS